MPKFKHTTVENWLDTDPIVATMVNRDHRDGSLTPSAGTDWIQLINERVCLEDDVPEDVRDAFWFAVGAIGYAHFYYPLFTLVSQQVLRVADYALEQFCVQNNSVIKRETFFARLERLRGADLLSEQQYHRWTGIRNLRNSATHPKFQENWGLAMSLELIIVTGEAIASLAWRRETATASS
jgi:hypothetical protein